MTKTISGHFIGAPGTKAHGTGGTGLTLPQSTQSYYLTASTTAFGGVGYAGAPGGIGVALPSDGMLTNLGTIGGGQGGVYETGNSPLDAGSEGGTAVFFGSAGLLLNSGIIAGGVGGSSPPTAGDGGYGVELRAGGLISNVGTISGGQGEQGGSSNEGVLFGGGGGGSGIKLDAGGIVFNSGSITGGNGGASANYNSYPGHYPNVDSDYAGPGGAGITASGGGTVINTGHITGGEGGYPTLVRLAPGVVFPKFGAAGGSGVVLGAGEGLLNFGVIAGGIDGGAQNAISYLGFSGVGGTGAILAGSTYAPDINFGTIIGGGQGGAGEIYKYATDIGDGGDGVDLLNAGIFINFGTIIGGSAIGGHPVPLSLYQVTGGDGIVLGGGSTLINAGHIAGADGADAVDFGGSGSSKLIIDPTAVFSGKVEASGSGNVIELASGSGTFSGPEGEFTGFQTVDVDAGGTWAVSGSAASLVNDWNVNIDSGASLDITSGVDTSSTGIFALTGKASLEIASLLGTNIKIEFLGGQVGADLVIDHPAEFGLHVGSTAYAGPVLEDFGTGDVIDLKGIGSTGLKVNYNTTSGLLQVSASGAGIVASLRFQNASLGSGAFHLAADGAGGSLLTHS